MKRFHPVAILCSTIFIILLLSATSCEIEQPLHLNKNDKKVIDTLYRTQTAILKKELDSICTIQYDSLIRLEVDSILNIRLEEIIRQRKRFEKRQKEGSQ